MNTMKNLNEYVLDETSVPNDLTIRCSVTVLTHGNNSSVMIRDNLDVPMYYSWNAM